MVIAIQAGLPHLAFEYFHRISWNVIYYNTSNKNTNTIDAKTVGGGPNIVYVRNAVYIDL